MYRRDYTIIVSGCLDGTETQPQTTLSLRLALSTAQGLNRQNGVAYYRVGTRKLDPLWELHRNHENHITDWLAHTKQRRRECTGQKLVRRCSDTDDGYK